MVDSIVVRGLEVRCVVGLYPRERVEPQRLLVDLTLELDTRRAAETETLAHTVDYAAVVREVAFLLEHGRFRMLETAAHVLARYLLAPAQGRSTRVGRVRVELEKPEALHHRASPRLVITRDASEFRYDVEVKPFGTVDIVNETKDVGIYRLNVAPGRSIPLHVHRSMDEAEMVLTEGLLCQDAPAPIGSVRRWPKDAAHRYVNAGSRVATILCVDAPRFQPEDEIEVSGEPADVPYDARWVR